MTCLDSKNCRKTCVALGLFDSVHLGHRAVILRAKELSQEKGFTATAFTFTNGAFTVKGVKPVISDEQKEKMLLSLGIEKVIAEDFESVRELSPKEFFENKLLRELRCGYIVCGYDFRFGKNASGDTSLLYELCEKNGVGLCVVDKVTADGMTVSTSAIRDFISQGEIEKANKLLGYRLCIESEISHGRKLGREMSFPTANQALNEGVVLPKFGVYISQIEIDGRLYDGITNVGVKPTVGSDRPVCETHILGFKGDLYGKTARLYLKSFLREEKKFSSVKELTMQIAKDIEAVKSNEL